MIEIFFNKYNMVLILDGQIKKDLFSFKHFAHGDVCSE